MAVVGSHPGVVPPVPPVPPLPPIPEELDVIPPVDELVIIELDVDPPGPDPEE